MEHVAPAGNGPGASAEKLGNRKRDCPRRTLQWPAWGRRFHASIRRQESGAGYVWQQQSPAYCSVEPEDGIHGGPGTRQLGSSLLGLLTSGPTATRRSSRPGRVRPRIRATQFFRRWAGAGFEARRPKIARVDETGIRSVTGATRSVRRRCDLKRSRFRSGRAAWLHPTSPTGRRIAHVA